MNPEQNLTLTTKTLSLPALLQDNKYVYSNLQTNHMGKVEPLKTNNIIRFMCSECRANTIYIKVNNYKENKAPFKAQDFVCTECNQGLMQTLVKTV